MATAASAICFGSSSGACRRPCGRTIAEVTEEAFDRTVSTNLKGTFFTVQTLLPVLRDGGSVILTSSLAATKGFPAFSVYSATKAAIRSLARTLTTDLKGRRIRVNALGPGHINM